MGLLSASRSQIIGIRMKIPTWQSVARVFWRLWAFHPGEFAINRHSSFAYKIVSHWAGTLDLTSKLIFNIFMRKYTLYIQYCVPATFYFRESVW